MQPDESEKLRNSHEGGKLLTSVRRFCLIAFLIAASTWPTTAQTKQIKLPQEAGASTGQVLRLSPEAAQVADEIGVAALLDQLSRKRADGSPMDLQSLTVRQEITEKVLAASLDVDSVNAVIDAEVEQIRGIRADIQARRDKAQNIINIASIFTGGVAGAITSAFQFKPSTVPRPCVLLRRQRFCVKYSQHMKRECNCNLRITHIISHVPLRPT